MKYLLEQKKKNKFKLILVILVLIIGGFVACKSSCKITTKAIVDNNNNIAIYKSDLDSNQADYINALTIGIFAENFNDIPNAQIEQELFRFSNQLSQKKFYGNILVSSDNSISLKIYNSSNTLLSSFSLGRFDNSLEMAKFTIILYNDKAEFFYYSEEERPQVSLKYTIDFSNIGVPWHFISVQKKYIEGNNIIYYNFVKTYFNTTSGGDYAITLEKIVRNDLLFASALNCFSDYQAYLMQHYLKVGEKNGIETGLGSNYQEILNQSNFKIMHDYQPQEDVGTIKKHTEILKSNTYYQMVMRQDNFPDLYMYDLITSQWVEPNVWYPNTLNNAAMVYTDHFLYFKNGYLKTLNDTNIMAFDYDDNNNLLEPLSLIYICFNVRFYNGLPYYLDIYTKHIPESEENAAFNRSSYYLFTKTSISECKKTSISLLNYNISYLTFNDNYMWVETPFNSLTITNSNDNYTISATTSGDYLGSNSQIANVVNNAYNFGFEKQFNEQGMTSWIQNILGGISGFFSIRIGSVSLGAIVLIPFAISLCWFIIRIFRGGK